MSFTSDPPSNSILSVFTTRELLTYVAFCQIVLAATAAAYWREPFGAAPIMALAATGALFGLLACAKRDTIFSARGAIWGAPAGVLAIPLLVLAIGPAFSFSGQYEVRGLSYGVYRFLFDTSEFDPIGASDIHLFEQYGRDKIVSFRRMSIEPRALDALAASYSDRLLADWDTRLDRFPGSLDGSILTKVRSADVRALRPAWWEIPFHHANLSFYVRYKDGIHLKELWCYDPAVKMLWTVDTGK